MRGIGSRLLSREQSRQVVGFLLSDFIEDRRGMIRVSCIHNPGYVLGLTHEIEHKEIANSRRMEFT